MTMPMKIVPMNAAIKNSMSGSASDTDPVNSRPTLAAGANINLPSIAEIREVCQRNGGVLHDGAPGLMHRIVDTMVDRWQCKPR